MSSSELDRRTVLRAAPHVMQRELDGESVLLDLESGVYFGLNDTGTVVWSLLRSEHTLGAIHEHLQAEFEVTADRAWNDLLSLVSELQNRNLVELARSV